uniref:Uncharacterized protein n=1 Tax=Arundo donax TaxID=35708 RepID=A0A0A9CVE8_ARUDO
MGCSKMHQMHEMAECEMKELLKVSQIVGRNSCRHRHLNDPRTA